ncbi:odorant receptor 4-like isoform X1 [Vespula maculifrons]|uniref:Odorant receptor 4-like isoform X1 n=1 Tax=Vespula maculifrons TaxID=7453 RepID=A0ABD2BPI6_VESMC
MGIWPVKNYVPLFLFFFTYLIVHCSLTFAHLLLAPKTVDNILSNLAENIELTMTLTKVAITRVNREALRKLFTEIKQFSLTEKYETKQEKLTLLNYTKLPLYFITIITSSMTLTEVLYYTNGVSIGIQIAKENNSLGYQLPYKTIEVVDLKDYRVYALFCAYQLMFIPSIVLGYVGFDYMFVNLSIQVIAQFAILSCKVKTILNNSKNCHEGMKELVLRHYRLIRLTEELENNFNFPIMQQLMGSTMHICISGYYIH